MELKADHKSVSTVTEEYQRLLKNKYNEVEDKNNEITRLRRDLADSSRLYKVQSLKESTKKDFDQRIEKIERQYEERIGDLKRKIKQK